jgi:hypothetical protein
MYYQGRSTVPLNISGVSFSQGVPRQHNAELP